MQSIRFRERLREVTFPRTEGAERRDRMRLSDKLRDWREWKVDSAEGRVSRRLCERSRWVRDVRGSGGRSSREPLRMERCRRFGNRGD